MEFLSPACNVREDRYGGDLEGRARIIREIIDGIKLRLGDFPIDIRIDYDEFFYDQTRDMDDIPGMPTHEQGRKGVTLDMSKECSIMFARYGVSSINVTAGCYGAFMYQNQPMELPQGVHVKGSVEIKNALLEAGYEDIAVATVGRINDPTVAEKILTETPIDFVCRCRALIADPYFPAKALRGDDHLIRPCIADQQACNDLEFMNLPSEYIYNVRFGKETFGEYDIEPSPIRKEVLVVGGGRGGLQAAEIAAEKAHNVILCEKTDRLGGQINLILKLQHRQEWSKMLKYYRNILDHRNVEVRLNTEVTPISKANLRCG